MFRADWCRREGIENCADLGDREAAFAADFARRRAAALADLGRPDWHKPVPAETGLDFRNAFLDGSVSVTEEFRAQMGAPCQWVTGVIANDADFYGRWRGSIEARPDDVIFERWAEVATEAFRNAPAIPPPPGCAWKTGPMPGAE